jgi:hypothetical protein
LREKEISNRSLIVILPNLLWQFQIQPRFL